MWLTFASLRPILLVALSLSVGGLAAIAVCYTVFGQIHALTLVFGMSLIGIAQDYAIYFICSRMSVATNLDSYQLLRRLLPGLSLTLAAALIGYLGLMLTSFPGLRQMAIFSSAGLVAAWLTVICWLPLFVKASSFHVTPLGRWVSEVQWPTRWHVNKLYRILIMALVAVVIIVGLSRLTVNDDIRILKKTPVNLQHDQTSINRLLNIPSSLQFYLVRGTTPQSVLEREEQLNTALDPLIASGVITGTQAVSNWVPSLRRQAADQRLITDTLWTDHGVLQRLSLYLGADNKWLKRMQARDHHQTLTPDALLNTPLSQAWRYLWLGQVDHTYASIVALRGFTISAIPSLQAIRVPGVQWVDKVASTSSVLGAYRHSMAWVIVGAYGVIYLALFLRYRARAWRIMAPPALASLFALAFFGILGLPLQLFHILALLLILGIGVDYGVFMNEQVDQRFAKLTVALSALSALLSFGLLALSQTPPLHAFGLTMALGLGLVWLLAPLLNNYWRMK